MSGSWSPLFRRTLTAVAAALTAVAVASCSSGDSVSTGSEPVASTGVAVDPNGPEELTPGDIPDDQVFVPFSPTDQAFTVSVPEGWARTGDGSTSTIFTDKLNTVDIAVQRTSSAPTVASITSMDLPKIAATASGYRAGDTAQVVERSGGTAILTTYRADAAPDPVTGKVVNDDVERYTFWNAGTEVVLTLSGPHGADNVDPWRTVTDSFTWS